MFVGAIQCMVYACDFFQASIVSSYQLMQQKPITTCQTCLISNQINATVTKVRTNDNFVQTSLFFHCLPKFPLSENHSHCVRSSS